MTSTADSRLLPSREAFRGQDQALALLDAYLSRGRLGGTILFLGQRGLGKTTLATVLARALCCEANRSAPRLWFCGECYACRSIARGEQPEYVTVMPRGQDITVDQIDEDHDGFAAAMLHPTLLSHRVIVIDDAHCLNPTTGNQMLKLFEESPDRTVFILVTDRPEGLLQTIHSRGQKVRLAPEPAAALARYLAADGIEATAAEEAALMSGGRYVDAMLLARMPDWRRAVQGLAGVLYGGRGVVEAADDLAGYEYAALWGKLLNDRGLSDEEAEKMISRPKTDVDRKLKTRRNELTRQSLVTAYDRAAWWSLNHRPPPRGFAKALWELKRRINQNVDPRLAQAAFELSRGG